MEDQENGDLDEELQRMVDEDEADDLAFEDEFKKKSAKKSGKKSRSRTRKQADDDDASDMS